MSGIFLPIWRYGRCCCVLKNKLSRLGANTYYLLALLAVMLVLGGAWLLKSMGENASLAGRGYKLVKVEQGMDAAAIAAVLHANQLLEHPLAFELEVRLMGLSTGLQAGVYQLECGMTNKQIASVLANGEVQFASFVMPEGSNIAAAAARLEADGLGSAASFMAAAKDYAPYAYMQSDNPAVVFKAEGFLFPATYDFPLGTSEAAILKMMVTHFNSEMERENILQAARERGLPLRDVINLAAMVEKEALFKEEQPRIAGIFFKRLAIGMPIQSDTTIQYILGEPKELITYKDTEIANAYNTYQNMGLPPGPIASPGMSAIKAVLQPEASEYLYFVAEKDGHHRFSASYSEHLRAIREIDGGN